MQNKIKGIIKKMKIILHGLTATLILLAVYLVVASSFFQDIRFMEMQFAQYWYFIISLAVGFGIQVGLYSYLRELVRGSVSKKTVAVTGTASTLSMISCCAHYLANILPMIGATGLFMALGRYQSWIFAAGLTFSFVGIAIMAKKIVAFKKHV